MRRSEEKKKVEVKPEPPKPPVEKVKYEKEINPKVYEKKPTNSYKELHAKNSERMQSATPSPASTPKLLN